MSIISTGAGHGGLKTNGNWRDSGAVGNGYQEADVARTINAKIIAKTKVPDTTDNAGTSQNDNLAKITAKINVCGDGWALSNHLNSFNGSATGVEVLYGSPSSKPMAEAMSKAIADALGLPNRGAKDGSWLYIAKHSNSGKKVLLIEWGFIDNAKDMKVLMANMDKAIDAMLACFGYSPSKPSTPVPTPPSKPSLKPIATIAKEVINGEWGNDPKRSADLKKAGYDAEKVRAEVNRQLRATSKPKPSIPQIAVDGQWGKATTKRLQQVLGLKIVDGVISHQYKSNANAHLYSAQFDKTLIGSNLVRAMQSKLGLKADGLCGADTIRALQRHYGTTVDGVISSTSSMVKAMQRALNQGKF